MVFIVVWLALGLLIQAAATITTICWTAAGQISTDDEPCYTNNSRHSLCCPAGAICSSNKLCMLPNGQAHRGSCTDRTWGGECPHFCLNEHTGNDGLTGVNMTLCNTNPTSTTYCCNNWAGRRCDCSNANTPKVTLELFHPMMTVEVENLEISETAVDMNCFSDIPWNTVGPILVTIMSLCILSMLLYLARMACIAKRKNDPTQNHGFMEQGRRFSDYFWRVSFDEKARANSAFSIGTLDTDADDTNRRTCTKSTRVSVGRRSQSEGSQNPASLAEMPPPVFRNDIFTKAPSRPSLAGTASKSLPRLTERPGFKRQDTDVGLRAE